MISVQIDAMRTQGALGKLARELGDRRAANKGLAVILHRNVMDNFDDEAHEGAPWAPLSPDYERHKERIGKERILVIEGHLRQSFLSFSDNDQAGVGALSTKEHADLAEVHEHGLNGIPARPMLPSRARATDDAIKVYGHFIDRARQESRL